MEKSKKIRGFGCCTATRLPNPRFIFYFNCATGCVEAEPFHMRRPLNDRELKAPTEQSEKLRRQIAREARRIL